MDNVLTIAEERLNLFAHMANSACGLSLWCFGMKKQLYTCTLNSTPFVRQYDILFNKWGVLLCQKEYQTNDIRRNSREWL